MKHFIDISDFNRKQLDAILKKAKQLKKIQIKYQISVITKLLV